MGARLLAIGAMVAMLLFAGGGAALAGRDWCARDPILVFGDGTSVQWLTLLPTSELANITAPVTFVFTVPTNAGPISVRFPIGSAAERVVISFSGSRWDGKGGIPVQATVLVSSSTIFKYATTVSGNVDKNTTFGAVSNVPSRANVRTDIAHWYPLVDASTIMASFDISRSTIIDLP